MHYRFIRELRKVAFMRHEMVQVEKVWKEAKPGHYGGHGLLSVWFVPSNGIFSWVYQINFKSYFVWQQLLADRSGSDFMAIKLTFQPPSAYVYNETPNTNRLLHVTYHVPVISRSTCSCWFFAMLYSCRKLIAHNTMVQIKD